MVTLRAVVGLAVLLAVIGSTGKAQEKPRETSPEFSLLVRIDGKALDPLREKDIRHEGRVDRMILGTRALGTSRTAGSIDVKMIPSENDAAFALCFQGTAHTKTTGHNGPAIIHSQTSTDFECTRQMVFDPRVGMVAGDTKIVARTNLTYEGFEANRRLGRRLISRVAERRANEQFAQVQAIAQRDNKSEILRAFDKRLDAQLVTINRQLDIARYVNALFGPASKPHLASRSCEDCILIGIGNEAGPRQLTTLPPQQMSHAPIEIWIHQSLLGERLASLATVVQRVDESVLPVARELEVVQTLLGVKPAERQFDVSLAEGWVIVALQNEPAPVVASSRR